MEPKKDTARIGVAGVGGIGAFMLESLYNYGSVRRQFPFDPSKIDLYDDDLVDASNMLHQNYSDEDIGKQKAELCAERYGFNAVTRFMTKDDFANYDVVFCCVDGMAFRKMLYNYGWEHPELFWIDGRCSSRHIGLYHSRLSRRHIESDLSDSQTRTGCLLEVDKKNNVSHVTPKIIANIMVQTYLNYIRDELQTEKSVQSI